MRAHIINLCRLDTLEIGPQVERPKLAAQVVETFEIYVVGVLILGKNANV